MEVNYDIVCFDIDGTLCPSGRVLTREQLLLIDQTRPESFKFLPKNDFNFQAFRV